MDMSFDRRYKKNLVLWNCVQQKSVQSRGPGSIEIVETHYMKFTPIDRTIWERNSHYDYYTNLLKCGYSVTVSLVVRKCSERNSR